MANAVIDYRKIADAVDYYVSLGYTYIEVPWLVSKKTIDITKPSNCRSFNTFLGDLVASGEQSFLEIRAHLQGRYVCVTPCFRDEYPVTELNQNYFMKVELIDVKPKNPNISYQMMLIDAFSFFNKYGEVSMVNTKEGVDLEINGIEVGSYGFRVKSSNYKAEDMIGIDFNDPYTKDVFTWVYGTGCAEPRLTQAINWK